MGRPTDPPPNFLEASAACVDVWERLFRDTPGELRGQDELSRFVEAGDWAASRLKDYDRAYKITRDYLQHVADLPKLEMAEEVINMRIAMRSFADSARELGRSEEARRFALALAAKTTGHRAVKFYLGIARAALADGACEEALTASRRVVELCEGEGHPWYVSRSMSAKTIAGRALCLSGRNDEGVKTVVSFLNQYARYSRTTSGLLTDDAKEITKFLGDRYEKRGEWRSALRFYEKLYESAYHRDDDWLAARVKRARERTGKASARASKRIDVKVFCPPRPLVRPGRSPRYRGRAKRIDKIVADGPVLWCVGDLRQDIGGRLLSFDTRTERWTDVDPEVRATCVLPTRERLYVGARGRGLWSRAAGGKVWEKLTEENGLPFNYVTELASDGRRIFVGFGRHFRGGVGELDPDGGVRMLPGAIGTIGGVNGMAAAGGYIWVAEPRKGTWRHDLRSGACELVHSHGSCPEAQLRADADGAWITSRGWHVYRTDRLGRMHAVFPEGFSLGGEARYHLDFRCGARAGGKVWLAGKSIGHLESCGIYSYDPETEEFVVYGPRDGIEATYAYCIAKTPGFLWFGTTDGLVRIRLPEQRAGRKGEGE